MIKSQENLSNMGKGILKNALYIDKFITIISIIAVILSLSVIFFSLLLEVFVRYFTSESLGWPHEMPNILFPWFVMMGIILAAQKGAHVSVNMLHHFLSENKNKILLVGINFISLCLFIYLAYLSLEVIEVVGDESYPVTDLNASWAYAAMTVGFAGLAITALTTIIRLVYSANPLNIREGE